MNRLSSLLVSVFYVLAVLCGVVLLAVVQLRASTGSAFDTWLLRYDANRAFDETVRKPVVDALIAASDRLDYTLECLKLFDETGTPKSSVAPDVLDEAKQLKVQKSRFDDLEWNDTTCIFRGFTMLNNDKAYFTTRIEQLQEDVAEVEEARKVNAAEYAALMKESGDFVAFKEMRNKWYSRLFVSTPYDLLVLLLVMSMGALGGMVRLLRDYGAPGDNPTPKDYLVIPLIGMVVAIGGYVLAKTGLLLLSSSGQEATLSPFMISLVGIVSGLLAREVIDAIAGQGRKFFEKSAEAETGGETKNSVATTNAAKPRGAKG